MFTKDDQSEDKQTTSTTDLFKDQLNSIQSEDGKPKYETVEEAIKALKHSQEHISKIESDNKTLREQMESYGSELKTRSSVEDVVKRLLQKEDNEEPDQEQEKPSPKGLDESSVEDIVSSLLSKRETQTASENNKKKVVDGFVKRFGKDAESKFQELAKETGLTVEDLEKLSAKSPDAVLRLVPDSQKPPSLTKGSINTGALFGNREEDEDLKPSTTSVLAGSTSKDLRNEMLRHKQAIYKKHNIEM